MRKFGTVRFDVNLNSRNSLEVSWNYQHLFYAGQKVDFLNNSDPAFPGFPNKGSIPSRALLGRDRVALHDHFAHRERTARGPAGRHHRLLSRSGPVAVRQPAGLQPGHQRGRNHERDGAVTGPNRRNTPVKNVNDNLNIAHKCAQHHARHQLHAGQLAGSDADAGAQHHVRSGHDRSGLGACSRPTNFPGSSSTDLTNARNIYAVLTGRITAITANANLSETGKYVYAGPSVQRFQQRETGVFGQDSWRVKPNLTINYGLALGSAIPVRGAQQPFRDRWLRRTVRRLGCRQPVQAGRAHRAADSVQSRFPLKQHAYNTQWNNLAPSIGVAWTPNVDSSFLHFLLGRGGDERDSSRILDRLRPRGHRGLQRAGQQSRRLRERHAQPDAGQPGGGNGTRHAAAAAAPDRAAWGRPLSPTHRRFRSRAR